MSRASEAAEEIVNVIANGSVKGYVDGTQKMAAIIDTQFDPEELAAYLIKHPDFDIMMSLEASMGVMSIDQTTTPNLRKQKLLTAAIEAWKEGEK